MMIWIADYCLSLLQNATTFVASVDWKNALAGFSLAGLPFLMKIVITKYQLHKAGYYKTFNGEFWLYHASGTKNNLIREKKIIFYRTILGSMEAKLLPLESNTVILIGKVLPSASSIIYVLFYTTNKKEIALLALNNPIVPTFSITTGIISGVSVEYLPMSAFALVSRERLTLDEAVNRVPKSNRLISKKMTGLTVK